MGAYTRILPSGYCPASVFLVEVDIMGVDLGVNNTSRGDVRTIHKKLAELYTRRSTVERLIRHLESYAACQAKGARRVRLKSV